LASEKIVKMVETYLLQRNTSELLMARANVSRGPEAEVRQVKCLWDTGSGSNLVAESHCRLAEDVEGSPERTHIRGIGGVEVVGRLVETCVHVDDQVHKMECFVVPDRLLPQGAGFLIGFPMMKQLQVDILAMSEVEDEEERVLVTQPMPSVFMSEGALADLIRRREEVLGPEEEEVITPWDPNSMIAKNTRMSEQEKQDFVSLLDEYKHLFMRKNEAAPTMRVPPYVIKLRDGAEPRGHPHAPRYGPKTAEVINEWADKKIAAGKLEDVEYMTCVCRVTVAAKPAEPVDNVRVCGNYIPVNEAIAPLATELPSVTEAVEMISKDAVIFTSIDLLSAFHQVPLHESSRYLTAVWAADRGAKQYTVVPFGLVQAGQIFCETLRKHVLEKLSPSSRAQVAYYMDDLQVASSSVAAHFAVLKELFQICSELRVTFRLDKTRVGDISTEFLGFEIEEGGRRRASDKTLEKIKATRAPQNKREVQSFLGLVNFLRPHCKDLAKWTRSLQILTRKDQPWAWTEKNESDYNAVKEEIFSRRSLMTPDWQKPFEVWSDSSDYAIGGVLIQRDDEGQRRPIQFMSRVMTASEQAYPIYWKEAFALVQCAEKFKYYLENTSFVTKFYTDHASLRWLKTSRKGKLNAWTMQVLGHIRFDIVYVKGALNTVSDALSRFPLCGPGVPSLQGMRALFELVVDKIPDGKQKRLLLWGGGTVDTKNVTSVFEDKVKNIVINNPSSRMLKSEQWDVACVIPDPVCVGEVFKGLLDAKRPFACLVPTDLVHHLSDGDVRVQEQVDGMAKIVALVPNQVWLVRGFNLEMHHQVFWSQAATEVPGVTLDEVKACQEELDFGEAKSFTDESGLRYIDKPGIGMVLVVDSEVGRRIARHVHVEIGHFGFKKVKSHMKTRYHWEGMSRDIERVCRLCELCVVTKAKRSLLHGRFSSSRWDRPGAYFGIDHAAPLRESSAGHTMILTVRDLFSRETHFFPVKTKSAEEAARVIWQHVRFRTGPPVLIQSDSAQELASDVMKRLYELMGTEHRPVPPYSQRSNGRVERVHEFLDNCLRRHELLDRSRMAEWHLELPAISWAHNVTVHSALECLLSRCVMGESQCWCRTCSSGNLSMWQSLSQWLAWGISRERRSGPKTTESKLK
jgi:hypothetical protein